MSRKKKEIIEIDLTLYTKAGKPRRRKPKKNREYFSQETEDAILMFLKMENEEDRSRLFESKINHSLYKLAENIIHTFKFYYTEMINVEDLKHEVVVFLYYKLPGYDQTLGKAYSYFGTIAKRYLILYNETNYKKLKLRADLEEVDEDKRVLSGLLNEADKDDLSNFVDSYVRYVETKMSTLFPNEKDQSIVIAVMEVFKRRDTLEIFYKPQIYFYIREITGQSTPSITNVMKSLKKIYKTLMKEMYLKGELETD